MLNNRADIWSVRFLGVGAGEPPLGSSACVVEKEGSPLLLIDCGSGTLREYEKVYQRLPQAIFITHLHLDHIADLESLFYRACFAEPHTRVRLFIAHHLVPHLHERIANYPGMVAEGGINFWDVVQLIPVSQGFWLAQNWFDIHAVRHHRPNSAYGIQLRGKFFYTGDTRPIPEILHHYCSQGETIFHDARVEGNPSHSGVQDLLAEYRQDVLNRMVIYHFLQESHREQIEQLGLRVARKGQIIVLNAQLIQTPEQPDLHAVG